MKTYKAKNNLFSIILRKKEGVKGNSLYFEVRERATQKRYYEFLNMYLTGEPTDIDLESRAKKQAHLRLSELTNIGYYVKDTLQPIEAQQTKADNFTNYFTLFVSKIKKEQSRQMPMSALKSFQKFAQTQYIPFNRITEAYLISYKNSISEKTAYNYYNYVLAVCKRAKKDGLIMANILNMNPAPKIKKIPVILTEEEIIRMEKTNFDERIKQVGMLQFATVQRISDVRNMTWEQITNEGKICKIIVTQKKTSKVLPCFVDSKLIEWIGTGKERKGLLFPDFKMGIGEINRQLNKWARTAGIDKYIGTHTFRRSGATLLYKKGVHIVTIGKILGHSSIETTMKYIGVSVEDIQQGLRQIQAITANFEYRVA